MTGGKKSILLTGATGFIGAHVARRLLADGWQVTATHRGAHLEEIPVDWVLCDLAESAAVDRVVETCQPSVIMHLASYVAGSRDLSLVEPTFDANLASTVHLLRGAVKHGVARVVLAGSLEEPEPDDGSGAVPSSPYAAAKWAASGYARMFHALYGLDVVTARIFMVYGPGQRDERKLIPYVIQSLLDGQAPEVGSGTRPVDWVYVTDVVEGLIRLATTPGLAGRRVDLGSGQTHTVRDVVQTLAGLVPEGKAPNFGALSDRPMEQIRVAQVADTEEALGWVPGTSLREGLLSTIEWYAARRQGAGADLTDS